MKAVWKTTLEGAMDEALLAVDLYNQPRQPRSLEGFYVHMHLAWLYLLHAEFKREGVDIRYKHSNGRLKKIDGEPKTWDLKKSIAHKWPEINPVRANLEITIAIRNKIEHRYHEAVAALTAGYAHSLLINFEDELTSYFGARYALGDQMRFPIYVGYISALSTARRQSLVEDLPVSTRDFLAELKSGIDDSIANDLQLEFRVTLVQTVGSSGIADRALNFIRESDLTEEQRSVLSSLGKTGAVVVREQNRPVSGAGMMRPAVVAREVERQIPFRFTTNDCVKVWRILKCRPGSGDEHPERTIEKYCVYDEPHGDYVYTTAFVAKIVKETGTEDKFRTFLGKAPKPKVEPVS
jgi:hypothetical protein